MKKSNIFISAFSLIAVIFISQSLFVVSEVERAVKLRFGEIVQFDVEPGLHFKWPIINSVRYFDSRILTLDAQPQRYLTSEKKALMVDSFIKWRVKDVAKYFTTTGGDEERAKRLLSQRVDTGLRNEFGVRTVKEVVSGERDQLMNSLTSMLDEIAQDELGVQVIDLRVKRIDLPLEVSESVYNRMRTERQRLARELRAQGNEVAEKIRATADKDKTVILADAYRMAEEIKGDGDAEATATYASAFTKDPEFYDFTRSLKAYQSTFETKGDILLIDPDSDFFKYLDNSKVD
ncbi:MAG: protein HflC [Gammaproteobacteria bacterium]|jgi:membrane protease subunit HflC|nr:protease modulator HflC [SAR86 cluster bacterium]GIS75054.1 MAG: protein HflC [Gammaproteobacteria bacterium]|tara:strand:+ start:1522 stop:2394 length:873 start_codon:yes stop_codon:yes gene_type:complete